MLENTIVVLQKTFIRSSQVTKHGSVRMSPYDHVVTAPLEHCRMVNSVCLNFSLKFEKQTREAESLFIITMRALTHRLKPAPFWPAKTSNWWVIHRTVLTWLPMTYFYSRTSRKKCVVNDFRCQKMSLKTMFWRCLKRSGKTHRNNGRSSKHSEYRYAQKYQTFLWKCRISLGNNWKMLG